MSSGTMVSTLTLNPGVNFSFSKAPVLTQTDAGQPLCGPSARSSIDPRDRNMQNVGDLLDRQKSFLVFLHCGPVR